MWLEIKIKQLELDDLERWITGSHGQTMSLKRPPMLIKLKARLHVLVLDWQLKTILNDDQPTTEFTGEKRIEPDDEIARLFSRIDCQITIVEDDE